MGSHLPSPVGALTIFNRHHHHEQGALIAGVCLETSLFKWLLLFWPRLLERSGMDIFAHLCFSFVHLFSGWMKCLPSKVALIVFNILQTNFLCSLFCELSLMTTVKHEQLCKLSAFEKNYSSVWCHAYICFHLIK